MRLNVRQPKADFRRDDRFQINYYATGEHRRLGTVVLKIVDISSTGAMVDGKAGIERGDRIRLRLPAAVDVEALCLWTWHQHAGLQFDHIINFSKLASIIDAVRATRL